MPRPAAGFSSVAGLTWDRLMNSTRRAAVGGTVRPLSELALGDVAAAVMRKPLSARMGGRAFPGADVRTARNARPRLRQGGKAGSGRTARRVHRAVVDDPALGEAGTGDRSGSCRVCGRHTGHGSQ